MTCPNIYLGTGRFGAAPLPANYWNDAIVMSSYTVQQGVTVGGQVIVRNHGTDDSPSTQLELYWSDPATNFPAVAANLILNAPATVYPGTAIGAPEDEDVSHNWTYPFPTAGHWCLLARLNNNTSPGGACVQQGYNSSSPATDPQSAIHNIIVSAPPPPPPGPGGGGAGAGMGFAFAAINMQRDVEKTYLTVRPLDAAKDRERLSQLIAIRGIDRLLARRQVKLALPKAVLLADGRERFLYHREHFEKDARCLPRMRVTGEVSPARLKHLMLPGAKLAEVKGKHDLDLVYGEARQMFVQVEPCGRENVAYAVKIAHKAEDGRDIGGLLCIFVPPHNYF